MNLSLIAFFQGGSAICALISAGTWIAVATDKLPEIQSTLKGLTYQIPNHPSDPQSPSGPTAAFEIENRDLAKLKTRLSMQARGNAWAAAFAALAAMGQFCAYFIG